MSRRCADGAGRAAVCGGGPAGFRRMARLYAGPRRHKPGQVGPGGAPVPDRAPGPRARSELVAAHLRASPEIGSDACGGKIRHLVYVSVGSGYIKTKKQTNKS